MAVKSYCDRCGAELKTQEMDSFFTNVMRDFSSNRKYVYPMLCTRCRIKLNKIIRNFVKEGKKGEKEDKAWIHDLVKNNRSNK